MLGLKWKCNLDETLDRRARFFKREMQDSILVSFDSVAVDTSAEWDRFDRKWGVPEVGSRRAFPSNEEIFERETIGMAKRGEVQDDWLPVSYSILDAGESMIRGLFGKDMEFLHRRHQAAFSLPEVLMPDYSSLPDCKFSLDYPWTRKFLSVQEYFAEHARGLLTQHPCLTMDALHFAGEMRGVTQAYLDIYEHPDELRQLMEIGLDFNIRFQEAQRDRIPVYKDGCFVWLGDWVPFSNAVALSVDAYVVCSPECYAAWGFEYQSRLIKHFGHGFLHFHCNRTDLAAEAAKLPGLELFQFGGDPKDPKPEIEHLPEMRAAVGDIPIQIYCSMGDFLSRLDAGTLPTNVWYHVGQSVSVQQANQLMERVRNYHA
jgi:hypothetical protein